MSEVSHYQSYPCTLCRHDAELNEQGRTLEQEHAEYVEKCEEEFRKQEAGSLQESDWL